MLSARPVPVNLAGAGQRPVDSCDGPRMLEAWKRSGFHVHASRRLAAEDRPAKEVRRNAPVR